MADDVLWRPPAGRAADPAPPDASWAPAAATALEEDRAAGGRDATIPLPPLPPPGGPAVEGEGDLAAVGGEDGVLLEVRGLTAGYGQLPVLHGIDLTVRTGETAVLLGLNGAGKTTTASVLCGRMRPTGGTVRFEGRDATRWSTRQAVANGIVLCPEGRHVFPQLSVADNLDVGGWTQRADPDGLEARREQVYGYFPRLRERADQLAGTLSGGEQQMCAIGRALMARPKLLIIDEASLGLAPVIVSDVFDIVREINADGVTVILIEQNIGALGVADVGLIMEQGTIVQEVRGAALADPAAVRKVFLG